MNREETAYKLIKLYYTNRDTFKNYRISLRELIEKYQGVLEEIKDEELQERIDKAIEYIESKYTITDDDVYLTLYSSDGTLDKLEGILKGED